MEHIRISGFAKSIPKRIVTNDELAQQLDTSDDWIYSRTGIHQRHIVTTENTSDLAIDVAKQLVEKNQIDVSTLDFVIVSTMSPDTLTPSVAAKVQGAIGANHAFAFDLDAACSGFVYGLSVANALLSTQYQRGILIGAEVLSKLVDWQDRSVAVLFGDGAAGILLERTQTPSRIMSESLKAYGAQSDALTAGEFPNQNLLGTITSGDSFFHMDGRAVYGFATREVPNVLNDALSKAHLTADDIDVFILHQANRRIIESIAKRFGQSIEKFPMNMMAYGNTSAASIGIVLTELFEQRQIHEGQLIALAGFGGGLTAGAMIIKL
ncbi:ketoacyl-ACP synthase III [Weissella diestrammenae]|uniref:Beta-ketoacyl-[acyl-carrier-protein] synthase III n=1 Tax=Weissella diestrammenae TaxID=1162633 RepID=A0A7G9T626_9LACO|nr:beta-ketoacyl-ACP synthase III [Weissella diestrammenae]MCM0582386.1 ketoacyl-ACP synthase III [Weissella diestrammenae]QNN75551.1 ketoacyl-ACP synthase III [Weissella diestrammenae]